VRNKKIFWKVHSKNKPITEGKEFFSDEFKDFMERICAFNPKKRLTMD
jgi:hypothetical protein